MDKIYKLDMSQVEFDESERKKALSKKANDLAVRIFDAYFSLPENNHKVSTTVAKLNSTFFIPFMSGLAMQAYQDGNTEGVRLALSVLPLALVNLCTAIDMQLQDQKLTDEKKIKEN